jgi:hypothetical protein
MLNQMQDLVQLENGPRYMKQGQHKGVQLTVICGYLAAEDQWAYHVMIKRPGQPEQRLIERPSQWRANTQQHAYDKGFAAGIASLDVPSGFQRVVK